MSNVAIVVAFILLAAICCVALAIAADHHRRVAANRNDPTVRRMASTLAPHFPELRSVDVRRGAWAETIDKSQMNVCVADPSSGQTFDDNTLVQVMLHELAHVKIPESDNKHEENFVRVYVSLLERAKRAGLYDPSIPLDPRYPVKGRTRPSR